MAGETVIVGCKLPNGLVLRVFDMVDRDEHVMGGGVKTVKVAQERADRITLNGWSHPQNAAPGHQIVEGFALTLGVPKEFWEKWLSQNKDSDVVRNNLVFAATSANNATAEAKDKREFRSGMERLNPANLPKGLQPAKAA